MAVSKNYDTRNSRTALEVNWDEHVSSRAASIRRSRQVSSREVNFFSTCPTLGNSLSRCCEPSLLDMSVKDIIGINIVKDSIVESVLEMGNLFLGEAMFWILGNGLFFIVPYLVPRYIFEGLGNDRNH